MFYLKHIRTDGPLPTSEFHLMDDDRYIGMLQIRHRPGHRKEVPEYMATQIYYDIDPAYRRKGYGKKILNLGLLKARELGLHEVLVGCMEDNVGSKKIIEGNGGVLTDEAFIENEGKMLKYRIDLN